MASTPVILMGRAHQSLLVQTRGEPTVSGTVACCARDVGAKISIGCLRMRFFGALQQYCVTTSEYMLHDTPLSTAFHGSTSLDLASLS